MLSCEAPVHAGYMVARALGAAPVLADAIVEALSASTDPADSSHLPAGAATAEQAEQLSATVWHAIWPVERWAGLLTQHAPVHPGNPVGRPCRRSNVCQ